ncbi:MAG: hypothetical protein QF664_05675 [Dehalococcoidia bacterium]|jgi:hypothetical protein|nr:hypothetical protein [Dehalococcoidia bacterium]
MAETAEPMTMTRVYTGDDGKTHLETVDIELSVAGTSGYSELVPATGVIFRRTPPDLDIDWHPAPRRQFVITLAGEGEIEVGDGSILPLGPGSIVLVEDIDGQGHITRGRGTEERLSIFIPFPEE